MQRENKLFKVALGLSLGLWQRINACSLDVAAVYFPEINEVVTGT
jgi:hypothetical protein